MHQCLSSKINHSLEQICFAGIYSCSIFRWHYCRKEKTLLCAKKAVAALPVIDPGSHSI